MTRDGLEGLVERLRPRRNVDGLRLPPSPTDCNAAANLLVIAEQIVLHASAPCLLCAPELCNAHESGCPVAVWDASISKLGAA